MTLTAPDANLAGMYAQSSSCKLEYIGKAGMSAGLQWEAISSCTAECASSCQDCKAGWADQEWLGRRNLKSCQTCRAET